jgi:hypothetical protein
LPDAVLSESVTLAGGCSPVTARRLEPAATARLTLGQVRVAPIVINFVNMSAHGPVSPWA